MVVTRGGPAGGGLAADGPTADGPPPAFPDRAEFKRLVSAGHGRALLAMRRWNETGRPLPAWVAGTVRWVCLRNRTYDPQCDGTRSGYLSALLQALGPAADAVTPGLWAALRRSRIDGEWDYDYCQLMCLAARWLDSRDDGAARDAVMIAFARRARACRYNAGWTLPYIGGETGYRMLLESVARHGDRPHSPPEHETDHWHETARHRLGSRRARDVVRRAVEEWPQLATSLGDLPARLGIPGCRRARAESCGAVTGDGVPAGAGFGGNGQIRLPGYAEFLPILRAASEAKKVEHGGRFPERATWGPVTEPRAHAWGKGATADDLRRAARDLATAADTFDQFALLWIFHEQAFPSDPAPLIRLLGSSHKPVVHRAYQALSNVEHPDVRDLALRGLDDGEGFDRAVRLLPANIRTGDCAMMRSRLLEALGDQERFHALAYGARPLAEEAAKRAGNLARSDGATSTDRADARTERRDARDLLRLAHDGMACSFCRDDAHSALRTHGWLDAEMRAERAWDSYVVD